MSQPTTREDSANPGRGLIFHLVLAALSLAGFILVMWGVANLFYVNLLGAFVVSAVGISVALFCAAPFGRAVMRYRAISAIGLLLAGLLYVAEEHLAKKPPNPLTENIDLTVAPKQRSWASHGLEPALKLKPLTISVHGQQFTNVIPVRYLITSNRRREESGGMHLLVQLEHGHLPSQEGDTVQIWGSAVENSADIGGLLNTRQIGAQSIMLDAEVATEIKKAKAKTLTREQRASLRVQVIRRVRLNTGDAWVYRLFSGPEHSQRLCMDGSVIVGKDLLEVSHCIRELPGYRPDLPSPIELLVLETIPLLEPGRWGNSSNTAASGNESE